MAEVIRKTLQTVILHRNGEQKVIAPGEVITLTEKEFNELRQINPDCLGKLDEAEVALMEKQAGAEKASEPDKTAAKGGKALKPQPDEDL